MGTDRQAQVTRTALLPVMPFALLCAAPGLAAPSTNIDLPSGRLGDAVAVLAQQTRVSISVPDARLWSRRVPAFRGRMTPGEAVARLARSAFGEAQQLAGGGWRIVPAKAHVIPAGAGSVVNPPAAMPAGNDIIVTASKRDIRFAEYPGSVSILDGYDLGIGGEGGSETIAARLASITSTHLGAGRNKLFIRGIADSSFTGPTQATVGQYFGDVRLNYNAPDPDLKLYDIASVEVLEGPNGTLYGAGSLGGIVRVNRNSPRLGITEGRLSGGVSLTRHGDPGADIGGMVNLPVAGEDIALRVVGYGVTEGGYIDNPLLGRKNVNRNRTYGGRGTLRFSPGDDWTIDIGATYQKIRGEDSQYADRDGPPLTRSSRVDQGFDAHYALGDIVIVKDWGNLRFVSSTGIADQRLDERYDATVPDGLPVLPSAERIQWPLLTGAVGDAATTWPMVFSQRNDTRFFSTENRLSQPMLDGFGWVVGVSYLHNRSRLTRSLGPDGLPIPVTGVTNRIDEYTAYGEASFVPMRGLTLTAGARVTHSRLSGEGENVTTPLMAAYRAVRASRNETGLLPSIALTATVLPDVTFFSRYQEGFRPGGLAIENDTVRRFRRDRIATWESGFRYGDPGMAFETAITFSYARWKDIQADYIDGAGLPTTANIGDGRVYSLAGSMGWRPLPGLSLDGALVYNDSRMADPSPDFAIASVSQLPNVARFSARGGMDYRAALQGDLDLRVVASARYVGRSRLGVGPVLGEVQGDYVDTALSLRIGRPTLGVTLAVTNLGDIVGNRFALGTPFLVNRIDQITPLRPRTVRLGFDARF